MHLVVAVRGQGTGRVESQPEGISCPGTCEADFPLGPIAFTATAGAGSSLMFLSGVCNSITPTCSGEIFDGSAYEDHFEEVAVFEPPPPFTYSVRLLPDGIYGAADINRSGTVAGNTLLPLPYGSGFTVDASSNSLSRIDGFPSNTQVDRINDRGDIAATVFNPPATPGGIGSFNAVLYREGAVTTIPTPGRSAWATSISADGKVAGYFADGTLFRAFVFDGTTVRTPGPADAWSEALGVNSSGVAVGYIGLSYTDHAVLFDASGGVEELAPGMQGQATSISESGYITVCAKGQGFVRTPAGALVSAGDYSGGKGSCLERVNDSGEAVGLGYMPGYSRRGWFDARSRAVVFRNGRLWDLAYLTGRTDLQVTYAAGINAAGQILAAGYLPGARPAWFVLTPQ